MMNSPYLEFLQRKTIIDQPTGIDIDPQTVNSQLFPFQRDIVLWSLSRGRAAIFADCGLGKTAMQLEWAKHIPGSILILAPLAVAQQTQREGEKFGITIGIAKKQSDVCEKITITNYEMLHHFDPMQFHGIILDESSILKSQNGKTRNRIIESFRQTPYRLACTATPAPNDHMEIGHHSEFLGAMTATEMLSMFFVHDGGDTSKWRLMGHAQSDFWKWVCSWAVMIRKPSDLGYDDQDFSLPPITTDQHFIDVMEPSPGYLFPVEAKTLSERIQARRNSIQDRVKKCAEIVNATNEPFLVWCNLNEESSLLVQKIDDAVEIQGSDSIEHKESTMINFTNGKIRVLVTKPSIAGFGMNWQHCNNVAFVGINDSYEQYYQAIRRCWRFGQKRPVHVHIIAAETERVVVANVMNKEKQAEVMSKNMIENLSTLSKTKGAMKRKVSIDQRDFEESKRFKMFYADCVDVLSEHPDDSIHFSIYSPPFSLLYTYSNSERDMGNCTKDEDFYEHYRFMVHELFRVLMPGRLTAFHCMNLPTTKVRDGVIGIKDFRGELIRLHEAEGFIYHSEVCIWKDPVTAMQRTKALGLLHKQLKKDACMSRQGIADYLVIMRKPGENPEPVTNTNESFPVHVWQNYASPIWTDINPSDTLQYKSVREHNDEKHICPLQLEVIRRALRLWTNENDTVLSPFAGIGSEGYCSIKSNRKFIGIELKKSYYNQAVSNLRIAEMESKSLFD